MRALRILTPMSFLLAFAGAQAAEPTTEANLAQLQAAFELNAQLFRKVADDSAKSGCYTDKQIAKALEQISKFEANVQKQVNSNVTETIGKTSTSIEGDGATRAAFKGVEAGAADRETYLENARKKLIKAQAAQRGIMKALEKIQFYHSPTAKCAMKTLGQLDDLTVASNDLVTDIVAIDTYYEKTRKQLAEYRALNKKTGDRVEDTEGTTWAKSVKATKGSGGKAGGKKAGHERKESKITGYEEAALKEIESQKVLKQQQATP